MQGLPDELAHLSWLVGRWGGIGEGGYPTVDPFRYEQVVEFATDGRPFLEYRSISWIVDEENNRLRRAATESGYWRPRPDNGVHLKTQETPNIPNLAIAFSRNRRPLLGYWLK